MSAKIKTAVHPMKVMVTGGTGFIGSHTVKSLIEEGHQVRMLVRSREKAQRVFRELHCEPPEMVDGNILDRASVAQCMDTCDALFHAAAIVSMDHSKKDEMLHTNRTGTGNVMEEAYRRSLKSIVHVSSITVLFSPASAPIDDRSPLVIKGSAYGQSKVDSDILVRSYLERGNPIRITYPTAVVGPQDPGLSESNYGVVNFLTRGIPLTSTGFQALDVRDLALIHVRLLEGAGTPGYYPVGGIYKEWRELAVFLKSITGHTIRTLPIPGSLLRVAGAMTDLLSRIHPMNVPLTHEGMRYVTQWRIVDSEKTLNTCGTAFRDPASTYGDTIRWLHEHGYISKDNAGMTIQGK